MSMPHAATELQALFAAPATHCRPMLRWWWPGGAVDEAALRTQLRGFHAAGFGGVEIQPFRIGLPDDLSAATRARVHQVFTPPFFETVAAVMDEAERLGMVVDLNFGSCWPFGGGDAITPELAATELSLAWTSVPGGARWQGRPNQPQRPLRSATYFERHGHGDPAQAMPTDWPERLQRREKVVAVLALRGGVPSCGPFAGFVPMTLPDLWGEVIAPGWVDADKTIDLTARLAADGSLEWEVPEGRWQIVVVKQFVIDQTIGEAAGSGPQRVASHLDAAAFAAHAQRVGEAGLPWLQRHAGKTWRAVFVDSLELPADIHWCDDFEAEFQRRRGYTLRPHLPLLLHPGWRNGFQPRHGAPLFDDAKAGPRVRADYRRTVSELMIERCYQPFANWAASHGLQSRVQAHGAPTDWLATYGVASMPETEDLMGGAGAHFLRVARSAAHQHGRSLFSAEAFVWLIEGLAVTPQKLRERADTFFAASVQQIVGHGASATIATETGPRHWYPWHAMEIGTMLDAGNPVFGMLRPMADYFARLQTILRRGRARVTVAVLAPLDLFAFDGAGDRLTPPAWHDALQDAGYDWDWINAEALQRLPLQDGALATPAGPRYHAVLLPGLPAVDAGLARRLAELGEAGIVVQAIERWPDRSEGLLAAESDDANVRACVTRLQRHFGAAAAPSSIGTLLRSCGVPRALALDLPAGVRFTVREDGDASWALLHNPGSAAVTLELPSSGVQRGQVQQGQVQQWQAWTGEVTAPGTSLSLPPRSAVLLRQQTDPAITPDQSDQRAATSAIPSRSLEGLAWLVRLEGHGLSARPISQTLELHELQDIATLPGLADFAGLIHYETTLPGDAALDGAVLDLGQVHAAAKAQIDDGAVCTMAEGPFTVQLASALAAPGEHRLRITVASLPENAWRDPAQPGGIPIPGRRLTPLSTGLLGPVTLRAPQAGEDTRWRLA